MSKHDTRLQLRKALSHIKLLFRGLPCLHLPELTEHQTQPTRKGTVIILWKRGGGGGGGEMLKYTFIEVRLVLA